MHWIPFDMILESASKLHQTYGNSAPSIQQWLVLPILFLKYGRPDNHLLRRYRQTLSEIPSDEMHFSFADIHTRQSAVLDADVGTVYPHPAFGTDFASVTVYKHWRLVCLYDVIGI